MYASPSPPASLVPHLFTVKANLTLSALSRTQLKRRFYDRSTPHEFLTLSQELAAPGEMRQAQTFDFNFKNVEKQYESYQGINVKLRYVPSSPSPLLSFLLPFVTSPSCSSPFLTNET